MDKEYVPPKCVSLTSDASSRAKGACVNGSVPNSPCWNGSQPQGGEGECYTGHTPVTGICTDNGMYPTAGDCSLGNEPGGSCSSGDSP
jgi:hypothetical protein